MKLNESQVETIQEKTGLTPIPAEAASESGLAGHFGENTFYLDSRGVYVFEEIAVDDQGNGRIVENGDASGDTITAIQIASVEQTEGQGVAVRTIEPQVTTLTVDLAA